MDKAQLRTVAEQLARPSGDLGKDISSKMNETNAFITARSVEALGPRSGEFIVELGPGNGALSRGLVQILGKGGRYLGIKVSQDRVPVAEKTLRDAGEADIEVSLGDPTKTQTRYRICAEIDLGKGLRTTFEAVCQNREHTVSG